jgi:hypothetical protein
MAPLAAPHNDHAVMSRGPNPFLLLIPSFGFINIPYKKMEVNGFFFRFFQPLCYIPA